MVKINILVDYLTISFSCFSIEELFEMLNINMGECEKIKSYYGLEKCFYFGGIKVHAGEYLILDMSGTGCRMLETLHNNEFDWLKFIGLFMSEQGSHLARIDIACDDKPGEGECAKLSYDNMLRHVKERRYICLSRRKIFIDGDEQMIVFGSSSSDRRLRIYNKALEKKYVGHWLRAEFQLRNDNALSFYIRAFELGSIGKAYAGMLFAYLRFTNEANIDNHTERKSVCRWWVRFCNSAEKIKGFYVGGLDYNMSNVVHTVKDVYASTIKTYLELKEGNVSDLLDLVLPAKLNKKQEWLLQVYPFMTATSIDYQVSPNELLVEALTGKRKDIEMGLVYAR